MTRRSLYFSVNSKNLAIVTMSSKGRQLVVTINENPFSKADSVILKKLGFNKGSPPKKFNLLMPDFCDIAIDC